MPDDLARLLDSLTPGIIAVDGPSGSGKTTYAQVVAHELRNRTGSIPQTIHMDDLYPGWDGLAQAVDLLTEWVLEPLSQGRDGAFRRWDWLAGERAELITVPTADWILVEGVGSGSAPCRPHLTALIWLEADREIRMARGIARDGETFRPFWERWAQQEEVLFAHEATREHADLIIRT